MLDWEPFSKTRSDGMNPTSYDQQEETCSFQFELQAATHQFSIYKAKSVFRKHEQTPNKYR